MKSNETKYEPRYDMYSREVVMRKIEAPARRKRDRIASWAFNGAVVAVLGALYMLLIYGGAR